jgi:DNA topoisomerase-2
VHWKYDEQTPGWMHVAFNKKLSDSRKEWIMRWRPMIESGHSNEAIDEAIKYFSVDEACNEQTISTFIDKELIRYAIENVLRSIPGVDGLKTVQRKILWTVMKKWNIYSTKAYSTMKVQSLASATVDMTEYHHGDASLVNAIVEMAADYVGSNNMPFFNKESMLGTRNGGGKDAAKPRYTKTSPVKWLRHVFVEEDIPLLNLQIEDGKRVEPKYFLPVIPLHLVNGSLGIGSAYSTFIPSYNPKDIITWLKAKLNGQELPIVNPWYKGFKGSIISKSRKATRGEVPAEDTTMMTIGLASIDKDIINITELPIGVWTHDYLEKLKGMLESGTLADFSNNSNPINVNFTLIGYKGGMSMKELGLTKSYGLTNMVMIDEGGFPAKYDSVESLLETFYHFRLPWYDARKANILSSLKEQMNKLTMKAKFIIAIRDKKIKYKNVPKNELYLEMDKQGFDRTLTKAVNINSLTQEGIDKILREVEQLREQVMKMEETSSKQLWLNDLGNLE